jgi:hypothetical protein
MAVAAAAGREPSTIIITATAANRTQLDPRLFMAARRGDSKQLKHLLQLEEEDYDTTTSEWMSSIIPFLMTLLLLIISSNNCS